MNTTEEPQELTLAPEQPGETPMKQLAPFDEFKAKVEKLKTTAATLTVSDASDKAGMQLARATRLSFREIRIAVEHRRKELVEDALRTKQRIDSDAAKMKDFCEEQETKLLELEQFSEREIERVQAEKRIARIAEITPYLTAPPLVDLGIVLDDRYAAMLQDAKDAHAARLAREAKERLEKEESEKKIAIKQSRAIELAPLVRFIQSKITDLGEMSSEHYANLLMEGRKGEEEEAEAREAQRFENERLKKEAAASEESARKEREAAAAALEKERAEASARAKEAKAKADAEVEKARKEREEAEAAAAKENARLSAIADKQRKEAAAAQAELQRQKDDAEKVESERIAAEKSAAAAPKKEKLIAFANDVRRLSLPLLAEVSEVKDFSDGVERFAKWVEKKANELGGELL